MANVQENGFFEYLELQGGDGRLVTKSELIAAVRSSGFSLSPRKLTFYIAEGLVPQSVRAGSRAGVYPKIVVELMIWILAMREAGASIETLRELLPIWKFLVRSRQNHRLEVGELELVARQFALSPAAQFTIPNLVTHVMHDACCPSCSGLDEIIVVDKDGHERSMVDPQTTIGFAIARPLDDENDQEDEEDEVEEASNAPREWIAYARITLSRVASPNEDPTVVRLGRKQNEPMPPDDLSRNPRVRPQEIDEEEKLQVKT